MLVGLTGGIGSGKSTVARLLAGMGAAVVDADQLAHQVLEPGEEGHRRVVREFGRGVLDPRGRIRRDLLRELVFADPARLEALERIVHPLVLARMEEAVELLRVEDPDRVVVCDVPLLFEAGLEDRFDQVVVVFVREEVQRARLVTRNGAESSRDREIRAQLPLTEKADRADRVIDNSGDLASTRQQVERLYRSWTSRPADSPGP